MLFVIGLNYTGTAAEPVSADLLARLANDSTYRTAGTDAAAGVTAGHSVYQLNQTPGMHCNSTPATLDTCFQQVTSALLRLTHSGTFHLFAAAVRRKSRPFVAAPRRSPRLHLP
jgi:hypothetical protein